MFRRRAPRQDSLLDGSLLRMLVVAPASGYAVTKRVGARQGSAPSVIRATYQRLHRLERQRFLTAEWRQVPGRALRARYYRVTARGLRRLHQSSSDSAPVPIVHALTMLCVMAIVGAADTAADVASDAAAVSKPSRQAHLTILLQSKVPISPDLLRLAGMDVTRIFGAIGVTIDWIIEAPPSGSAAAPSARRPVGGVVVRAVIATRLPERSRSDEMFLGTTPPGHEEDGADVVLFHNRIQTFAQLHRKAASYVLALVLAHEIGHVLLPPPAHAVVGIMISPWDSYAMDQAGNHGLLFTARQGEMMRQRLQPCCEIATIH